jgi:putative endonuclease
MKTYYVYIFSSNNKTTIYIGVTNNLQRRVLEHKSKELKGFSNKYNCVNLVYFEKHNSIEKAIERETQIKRWKREWKDNLIKILNPEWLDLARDWSD